MNDILKDETFIGSELKKYKITDAYISKISKRCMALKVINVDDTEGYNVVHKERIDVKNIRVGVEKKRKELKAESLKFGKAVDTEAKRITSLLLPIEEHLINQEKIVDDEKERKRTEKERLERERIEKEEAIKKQEEEARQAKIQEQQRIEFERLEKIRIEQEEKEAKIRKEQEKIEAEKRAIAEQKEKEQREKIRQQEIEQAKQEARIEAEKKAKREEEEKRIKEEQAKKEAALKAALMPDNEKLSAYAEKFKAIPHPSLSHEQSHQVLKNALKHLNIAYKILKGG